MAACGRSFFALFPPAFQESTMIRTLLTAAALALSVAACGELPYTNVDNAKLLDLQAQGVAVYDIRTLDEWRQTGVVDGAKTLTYFDANGSVRADFMPTFAADIAKDEPVVLICRSGNRSDKLARTLVEAGYTKVYNAQNGMLGWQAEKRPTVSASGGG
jgi:rhodanese-related sulfurtransferase